MDQLVLLLRGINVGTAKQVPMAQLRALLEGAGYENVRTHLRSGNVLVDSPHGADAAAADAAARLQQHFGFTVDVVVRTVGELAAAVAADPFAGVADDPTRQHVAFLSGRPAPAALRALTALELEPERLHADGRELHLWCPGGLAASPLAKALARAKLDVVVTVRNRRTLGRLLELARG